MTSLERCKTMLDASRIVLDSTDDVDEPSPHEIAKNLRLSAAREHGFVHGEDCCCAGAIKQLRDL